MSGEPVYLDHAATAPIRPEVVAAMAEAMAYPGNPSSLHRAGRRAREMLERARRQLADRLRVAPDRVIFTSGGTEANHLALSELGGDCLVSSIEHASVLEAIAPVAHIPVDQEGRIDLQAMRDLLAHHRPRVTSVMLANNETGVIQPIVEASRLARAHGSLFHCDAVQAFGKLPIGLAELDVDLLSISAHKIGGPPGVGALIVREGCEPRPLQRGGGQERRRRAGTENLPGIVGFGAALDLATDWAGVAKLRAHLEAAVRAAHVDARIVGAGADRLPGVTCIVTPGLAAETQLMALDLAGVAVSSGAACSSGKVGASHVLAAMGFAPDLARCAIRISLGWSSCQEHVARFVQAWAEIAGRRCNP